MPHRRHTITVATSALLFVCLMLHAQGKLYAQTPTPYNDAEAYEVYDSLLQPLLDSFVALNRTTWQLRPELSLGTPYELVSREDLHAFFKSGGRDWDAIATRYPDSGYSYITLSPVAFNVDRPIAVYISHDTNLCGNGSLSVLEKKDGVWKNLSWKGTSCAWAS